MVPASHLCCWPLAPVNRLDPSWSLGGLARRVTGIGLGLVINGLTGAGGCDEDDGFEVKLCPGEVSDARDARTGELDRFGMKVSASSTRSAGEQFSSTTSREIPVDRTDFVEDKISRLIPRVHQEILPNFSSHESGNYPVVWSQPAPFSVTASSASPYYSQDQHLHSKRLGSYNANLEPLLWHSLPIAYGVHELSLAAAGSRVTLSISPDMNT